jgi:hypothetical protein
MDIRNFYGKEKLEDDKYEIIIRKVGYCYYGEYLKFKNKTKNKTYDSFLYTTKGDEKEYHLYLMDNVCFFIVINFMKDKLVKVIKEVGDKRFDITNDFTFKII